MASEQTIGHSLSFTLEHFVLGKKQFWTSHTGWQNTGKTDSVNRHVWGHNICFKVCIQSTPGCTAGIFTLFPSCHHQPEAHFQVRGAQEKTGHWVVQI
jgi:hypothetical protein